MKGTIICIMLLVGLGQGLLAQQRLASKATWNCQYILLKDSTGKIEMEKMQGIGGIKFMGDSTVSITTICNTGTSRIRMSSDSTLKFTDIAMTFLWCDQGDKESVFIRQLREVSSFAINESGLKLFFNNKKGYLFFVSQQ
jgi:heat shock protein HslJ